MTPQLKKPSNVFRMLSRLLSSMCLTTHCHWPNLPYSVAVVLLTTNVWARGCGRNRPKMTSKRRRYNHAGYRPLTDALSCQQRQLPRIYPNPKRLQANPPTFDRQHNGTQSTPGESRMKRMPVTYPMNDTNPYISTQIAIPER